MKLFWNARLAANAATLLALVARNTTIEISNQRFAPANLSFLTAR
jgi:hypothetical protein